MVISIDAEKAFDKIKCIVSTISLRHTATLMMFVRPRGNLYCFNAPCWRGHQNWMSRFLLPLIRPVLGRMIENDSISLT